MKKLLLLSTVLLGLVAQGQADGFRLGGGFPLPLPPIPLPGLHRHAERYERYERPEVCGVPYRHVVYETQPGWHYCYVDRRWEPMYQSCYFRGYYETYGRWPQVVYPDDCRR